MDWGIKHQKFVALWNDRLRRIPQMVMATDPQPSSEYIQWYCSCGKPYILGGQSTVIPPHVQQLGGSDAASPMDPDLMAYYPPQLAEPEQEPQPDPEQSQSNVDSHGYRPDLAGSDYFSSFHHETHSSSSFSAANEPQDFSSMFATPPPVPNDDVGRRPKHDRLPPNRYTPRTTPSNHQF
ncbi:hypothetical protein V6Z12_D12G075200 [Gossypium hirsutum]